MSRADLDLHFAKIDELVAEIESAVPPDLNRYVKFRADLAGLLVVAMAATYETCVKEVLCDFASRSHEIFGGFALRNYEKLNSRVQVSDLRKYCKLFSPHIYSKFNLEFSKKKTDLLGRSGKNIETSYEQILAWRHDFAHAGIPRTTIEEATATHRVGKRVMYVFAKAFNQA